MVRKMCVFECEEEKKRRESKSKEKLRIYARVCVMLMRLAGITTRELGLACYMVPPILGRTLTR